MKPEKKIQYLIIDSEYVTGTNNTFSIELASRKDHNTALANFKTVIGFKLVDFFITQVGQEGDGTGTGVKFLDIIYNDIPAQGQLLNPRHGVILNRIPIERSSSNIVVNDKQWKGWGRETSYFTPMVVDKLHFKIFEMRGDGSYVTLRSTSTWTMTFEITSLVHEIPQWEKEEKEDPLKLEIEKMTKKMDEFISVTKTALAAKLEVEKPKKKKIPLYYLGLAILLFGGVFLYIKRRQVNIVEQ